ncbi:MAG: hypothetical protein WC399_03955 [Bacilli bacterium]|jgi:uncharacterized membrane protein YwaF
MDYRVFGSLFDGSHTLYVLVSLAVTVLLLWLPHRFLKKQRHKDLYLKFWSWTTVFLHLSPLWVEFLKGNDAVAADNMIFPIYFCNMSMYFLLIVSLWADKKSKTFKNLATVAAYSGMFGALISLFYPQYYLDGTTIFEWGVFKSMLSHSTMLIGCLYLFVGGYFKIERKNVIVYAIGLLFFGLIGVIVNQVFAWAGLHAPNAMYLQHPPIESAPFLNAYFISAMMLLLVFGISSVYQVVKTRHNPIKTELVSNH